MLHRMSLDTVLEELGWELPEPERVELNLAWHRLDGWADTREGLAALRPGRNPWRGGRPALQTGP